MSTSDPLNPLSSSYPSADLPASYRTYATFVAKTLLAATVGSVPSIPNPLASAGLDTAILTDPVQIQAYRQTIADQMNDGCSAHAPRFEDLSARIADIIIDTTVQGAGTLEVHIIDPMWNLLISGFIQADEEGYLWPPIDVNFPSGTNCVWTLCQLNATWDAAADQANLILTFEDKIISLLRDVSPANGGLIQGSPNQSLSGFCQMLVASANKILSPAPPITYVSLVSPQDPNYTVPINQTPAHATDTVRKNASKLLKGLTAQMDTLDQQINQHQLSAFPPNGYSTTLTELENRQYEFMNNNPGVSASGSSTSTGSPTVGGVKAHGF